MTMFPKHRTGKSKEVTKILNLSEGGSLLFVGQKGSVVGRSSSLESESEKTWDLCLTSHSHSHRCQKIRMSSFSVTDATYLNVSRHYCISTSNRSLHFMLVTSSDQWETFRLTDLPTIPTCLEKKFSESNGSSTCELFVGDHVGDIYIFTFFFPRTMLFARSYTTETQVINFGDLSHHRQYVVCRRLRKVHSDIVDKILCVPQRNILISNSKRDSAGTLVWQDLVEENSVRSFPYSKRVTCFDADIRLIATGGKDFLVRVFKLSKSPKHLFTLYQHCAVIAEVKIWSAKKLLLSICKELELRLWMLHTGETLGSVLLTFPAVLRNPYMGKSVLHILEDNSGIFLVTCSQSSLRFHVDKLMEEYKALSALSEETEF